MNQSTKPISGGLFLLLVLSLLLGSAVSGSSAAPSADSHTFPETGHTVGGAFWSYWQQHGGLAQQGYPLSEEAQEVSDLNAQTYMVQYFERAVFEKHPENQPPYDVLLSQLGTFRYKAKYGDTGAPGQQASTANARFFPETKHTLGGKFRAYWESHGALAQQGYPISDEFTEVSDLDNKSYRVQYFERAVFELHPENAGTPYEVLLSQLGKFRLVEKQTPPTVTPQPEDTATTTPTGEFYPNPNGHGGLELYVEGASFQPRPEAMQRLYDSIITIGQHQGAVLNGTKLENFIAPISRGQGSSGSFDIVGEGVPATINLDLPIDYAVGSNLTDVPENSKIHNGDFRIWTSLFVDTKTGQLKIRENQLPRQDAEGAAGLAYVILLEFELAGNIHKAKDYGNKLPNMYLSVINDNITSGKNLILDEKGFFTWDYSYSLFIPK